MLGNRQYWWEQEGEDCAQEIAACIRYIDSEQSYKIEQNLKHMRMYGNLPVIGLHSTNLARFQAGGLPTERYSYNVARSCVDTTTNKIAKNKIKVTFLTDAGQQSAQRKAKQLGKYSEGMFTRTKAREHMIDAIRDSFIFGDGWVKVFPHNGKLECERKFPNDIKWDDRDAQDGKPTSLFEVKIIQKDIAMRLFPKAKEKIMTAKSAFEASNFNTSGVSDSIYIYEAWHLPSLPGEKDGKHVICIENEVLFKEKWDRDYYPFVNFKYAKRLKGFMGSGMIEQLVSKQVELNKTMAKIQLALHLCSPKLIVKSDANAVKSKFNNEVGGIIETQGEFSYQAPTPIDPMYFQHQENLIRQSYEEVGVSMMDAQSKKIEGIDSGKAMREFNDIASDRFMLIGQMWENAHVELAELFIKEQKKLMETTDEDLIEKVVTDKFIETINFKDVDMDRDAFVIKAFPTSYLSQTPMGRYNDLKDMMGMGLIDQKMALKLLDFPDLEGYMKYQNSDIEDIEYVIERIVDYGDYMAPDPKQNLQLGMSMMLSAYLQGRREKLEQERLDLLQLWMLSADAIIKREQEQAMIAQQQSMAAQQMPQGV